MTLDRRQFLGWMGTTALATLTAHTRWVQAGTAAGRGYGVLRPARDARGVAVLALPDGFTLTTFSRIGEPMGGGAGSAVGSAADRVPRNLDGMAAFARPDGLVRLIRNHEVRNAPGDTSAAVPGGAYDPQGGGGCTVLDVDTRQGRLVQQFVGLSGTQVNCAGGPAWQRRAWLSCEETIDGPKAGFVRKHGYVFEVPVDVAADADAIPLTAMGRFKHEVAAADVDGTVYMTEDAGGGLGSGFYRFVPNDRAALRRGGRLQMLRVPTEPFLDVRQGQRPGRHAVHDCDWVDISDPDPDLENGAASCFEQGRLRGGTLFNRLEGLCLGADGRTVFFTSTSGGDAKGPDVNRDGYVQGYGQVWRYSPLNTPLGATRGRLALHFESPGGSVLDSPDNLCVTPQGGLLLCEDDASPRDRDRVAGSEFDNVNRLVGLGPDGAPFTFAVNLLNDSELAGVCFSPDGQTLFVNVFGDGSPDSGMTCAINGPWARGVL